MGLKFSEKKEGEHLQLENAGELKEAQKKPKSAEGATRSHRCLQVREEKGIYSRWGRKKNQTPRGGETETRKNQRIRPRKWEKKKNPVRLQEEQAERARTC